MVILVLARAISAWMVVGAMSCVLCLLVCIGDLGDWLLGLRVGGVFWLLGGLGLVWGFMGIGWMG